ncbi:MAG: CatA-like O-acetyltransferase [Bacteroidales bacterium]|nr:CatA-like O-acetyltransferase [Bacteroidales bacterium]
MEPIFHVIDRKSWERNIHFDYYYNQIKCKYNLNANIDVTELVEFQKGHGLKFFPVMLYVIMKAVNWNKEFRMGFNDEGELGYWNEVVPCYTLFHDESKIFTDIWSEYNNDFEIFYKTVLNDMQTYGNVTGVIKARPDQPKNFCSVSCLPWLSFTGFAQDTYTETSFLFPLIMFGKYFEQGRRILLPFSVFVSHAVADGYHTCKLINDVQEIAKSLPEQK